MTSLKFSGWMVKAENSFCSCYNFIIDFLEKEKVGLLTFSLLMHFPFLLNSSLLSLLKNENAAADTRTAAGLYHIVSGKGVAGKLPSLLSVNPSARLAPSSSGTRPLTCHSHLPPAPRVWWPGGFMRLTCRGTTGRSGPMKSMSAPSQLLGSG